MTPAELSSEVRAAFAVAARYLSTLAESDPHASAGDLLTRPDVDAALHQSLDHGRELAQDAVRAAWGASPHHEYLDWVLGDIDRSYDSLAVLRAAVRTAWLSAPTHAERAIAVKWAVLDHGEDIAIRNRLSMEAAAVAAQTEQQIATGLPWQDAGERVWKQWRCRHSPPDDRTCHWCRILHGMVLPLSASFPAGEATDLTGHGSLTQPPRLYHGILRGPPRHPRCRCRIVVTTSLDDPDVLSAQGGGQLTPVPGGARPGFLAAADIRALPETRYQGLLHFLEAAVHELGQVLSRLRRAVSGG